MSFAFQQSFTTANGDNIELIAGTGDWINLSITPSGDQTSTIPLSKKDTLNLIGLMTSFNQGKVLDAQVDPTNAVAAPVPLSPTQLNPVNPVKTATPQPVVSGG